MEIELVFERSFMSKELASVYENLDELNNYRMAYGDEPRWVWGPLNAFHLQNDWQAKLSLPEIPKFDEIMEDNSKIDLFIDYFSTLHALTQFKLRWKYPALGISLALRKDIDIEDNSLLLIKKIWARESNTRNYAAWASKLGNPMFGEPQIMNKNQISILKEYLHPLGDFDGDGQFHQKVITQFGEDLDRFHLRSHLDLTWSFFNEEINSYEVIQKSNLNFIVRIRNCNGWYGVLKKIEESGIVQPDSVVAVEIENVGNFGKYRLSSVTGEWYSGIHDAHLLGN